MTLDQMHTVVQERIPTASEFLDFVEASGWQVAVKDDGKAALRAPADDRMALALARMLGREPYRTNVLQVAKGRWRQAQQPRREFLWRDGHTYLGEPADTHLWQQPDRHPTGAWWWRWHGETAWTLVEGLDLHASIDRDALRAGAYLPAGEHLAGLAERRTA